MTEVIAEMQPVYSNSIVTEVKPFEHFYEAEANRQDYYRNNPQAGYCMVVIEPKLQKFRKMQHKLKKVS